MSNRRQVTVLYGENKLQKTISLPASATVAAAKKIGSDEILQHLRLQSGVPPAISLDDECTDFYPNALDNTRIRDLKGQATIMVWPAAAPGSTFTPSPIIDALSSASTELENMRAQQSAEATIKDEKQSTQEQNSKPGSSSICPSDTADGGESSLNKSLSKLSLAETNNAELRESNTALKVQLEETDTTLQTAMKAVLGDEVAINKIRNQVLLDLGRDKLAVLCGYKDWKVWQASSHSREAMLETASTRLNTASDTPHQWTTLGSQSTALRMLLLSSSVHFRGDLAACASAPKLIGESVLSLTVEQEKKDMIAIYQAVFGTEPVL